MADILSPSLGVGSPCTWIKKKKLALINLVIIWVCHLSPPVFEINSISVYKFPTGALLTWAAELDSVCYHSQKVSTVIEIVFLHGSLTLL